MFLYSALPILVVEAKLREIRTNLPWAYSAVSNLQYYSQNALLEFALNKNVI